MNLISTIAVWIHKRRQKRDEATVLRALAAGTDIPLPLKRQLGAFARLSISGAIARVDGWICLTKEGWTSAGMPLGDAHLQALRQIDDRRGSFAGPAMNDLRVRGLIKNGGITPAGRAVIES